MKVRYIGKEREDFIFENQRMDLIPGKVYDVLGISPKMKLFQIVDESGEDYLYPPSFFEIVEQ